VTLRFKHLVDLSRELRKAQTQYLKSRKEEDLAVLKRLGTAMDLFLGNPENLDDGVEKEELPFMEG